jgi:hypothetical protein
MRGFVLVVCVVTTGCMPSFSQSDADSLADMIGTASVSAAGNVGGGGGGGGQCPANAPLQCSAGWCCPYGQNGRTDVCCNSNPQSMGCTSNGACLLVTDGPLPFLESISERAYCPGGGRIEVNGQISGTIDNNGSGLISGQLFETFTDCSDGNNTFNGDPYLTATSRFLLSNGALTDATMTFSGGLTGGGGSVYISLVLYLATATSPYNLLSGTITANGQTFTITWRG